MNSMQCAGRRKLRINSVQGAGNSGSTQFRGAGTSGSTQFRVPGTQDQLTAGRRQLALNSVQGAGSSGSTQFVGAHHPFGGAHHPFGGAHHPFGGAPPGSTQFSAPETRDQLSSGCRKPGCRSAQYTRGSSRCVTPPPAVRPAPQKRSWERNISALGLPPELHAHA